MQLSLHLPLLCLCLLANLQVFRSHPINTGNDVDTLKALLRRLEESLPAETPVDQLDVDVDVHAQPDREEEEELQARLDEAAIRELLSAKNLRSVRNNDSSRKSSNCFGGRMDRIGAMSSLGCNTAGRFSKLFSTLDSDQIPQIAETQIPSLSNHKPLARSKTTV
ncbi:Brain natriuretic peptide [Merluccius polli]|uniref:Brain natriuretic peptide n=1 Tax=Merluccius polli TaxID=89951 RepID=A0AA47NCD1_MERPO|nr:Brain natriuretic peptide [Merluccius polli]